jgi:hypothetical protein
MKKSDFDFAAAAAQPLLLFGGALSERHHTFLNAFTSFGIFGTAVFFDDILLTWGPKQQLIVSTPSLKFEVDHPLFLPPGLARTLRIGHSKAA